MIKRTLLASLLFVLSSCSSLRVLSDEEYVFLPNFQPTKPIELALVLGGGGSKGLAHLGAIQELERAGIRPDLIIGCSAGAIAGALYADQPELQSAVDRLIPLKRSDVLDYSYMNPVFGIVQGDLLQKLMGDLLNAKFFEDLKIPLIVVATDLISGEPVEICCGDLPSAVRASCSLPGVFKPYPLYGRHCIDGGASCPIPVTIAKKYGAKVVLAIDLSERLPAEHPTNLFGVTRRGLEIAYRKFIEQSLALADISIRMNFEDLGTFNDDQNRWLYQQGQEIIRAHLPDIKTKLYMAKLGLPSKRKAIERQITFGLETLEILPFDNLNE